MKDRWIHFRRGGGKCLCGKETPSDIHSGRRFDAQQVTMVAENVTCKRCMKEMIVLLVAGRDAVSALIADSNGVNGLHLNGDIATWDSLQEGGSFEEWLLAFNISEGL